MTSPPGIPAGTIGVSSRDEEHEPVHDPFDSTAVTRGDRVDSSNRRPGGRSTSRPADARCARPSPVPGTPPPTIGPAGSRRPPMTASRYRSRWPTGPTSRRTAPRRACSTATAHTSPASIRGSPPTSGQPARPRRGLRHRAHPGRRRVRPRLVAAGAAAAASAPRSPTSSPPRTPWSPTTGSTAAGSRPAVASAGGLLQGAVFSMAPQRWRAHGRRWCRSSTW